MIDQLQEIDISVLDELIEIKKQKDVLDERLQKLEEEKENVSEDVFKRVSEDYGKQLDGLVGRSKPLKDQGRRQYARLQELLEQTRSTLAEARADDEELQLRHRLGEFDEDELAERRSGVEARLKRHDAELDALTDIRERFLAAFDTEEELNKPVAEETVPPPEDAEASEPDEGTILLESPEIPPAPDDGEADDEGNAGDGGEAEDRAEDDDGGDDDDGDDTDGDEGGDTDDEDGTDEGSAEPAPADDPPATAIQPPAAEAEEPAAPPSGSANEVMPPPDMPEHGAAFDSPALDETEVGDAPGVPPPPAAVPPLPPAPRADREDTEDEPSEDGTGNDGGTAVMKLASLMAAEPLPGGQDVYAVEPLSTIGRSPQNKIQVLEPSVSRQHAEIHLRTEGYVLKDLGSENGTFVNGDPIKGECPLRDNDRVQFGTIRFIFTTEPPP